MKPSLPAALALLAAGPAMAQAVVPDPTLTPGAIRSTDAGEICSTPTRELLHWSRTRDDHIMAEYGLPPGPHSVFEIDHFPAQVRLPTCGTFRGATLSCALLAQPPVCVPDASL
jgi:hypothetical protein